MINYIILHKLSLDVDFFHIFSRAFMTIDRAVCTGGKIVSDFNVFFFFNSAELNTVGLVAETTGNRGWINGGSLSSTLKTAFNTLSRPLSLITMQHYTTLSCHSLWDMWQTVIYRPFCRGKPGTLTLKTVNRACTGGKNFFSALEVNATWELSTLAAESKFPLNAQVTLGWTVANLESWKFEGWFVCGESCHARASPDQKDKNKASFKPDFYYIMTQSLNQQKEKEKKKGCNNSSVERKQLFVNLFKYSVWSQVVPHMCISKSEVTKTKQHFKPDFITNSFSYKVSWPAKQNTEKAAVQKVDRKLFWVLLLL